MFPCVGTTWTHVCMFIPEKMLKVVKKNTINKTIELIEREIKQ